jgi:hypothetical protein
LKLLEPALFDFLSPVRVLQERPADSDQIKLAALEPFHQIAEARHLGAMADLITSDEV